MSAFGARERWILLATIIGSSLVFIDATVVTLALPSIQRAFHASASGIAWIVESYTLALGALLLLGGAIADRIGRRRTFIAGTVLFAFGSLGCAFAWSLPTILTARVVQGVGGMLLAPASLALIGAHFLGDARARAIAYWSSFGALTSALGPALGGILIDTLGWRAVFWINVPLAVFVVIIAARHVQESRNDAMQGALDIVGAALVATGLGALTYALIGSTIHGWSDPRTVGTMIFGAAMLAMFVLQERRSRNPLLPLSLFASRTFTSINLATLFLYGALGALFYEMPFVMIQVHRYTATQTALATLPLIACLVLLARFGTQLAYRFGLRTMLTCGPTITACGFFLIALLEPHRSYLVGFLPGIVVTGIGMGLTVAPLTTGAIDAAGSQAIGIASGVNSAVARIAGLLAIAALAGVVWLTFNATLDRRLGVLHVSVAQRTRIDAQRALLGGAHDPDPQLEAALRTSFETAFRAAATCCAALALAAGFTSLVGIERRR